MGNKRRAIAEVLGTSHETVANDLRVRNLTEAIDTVAALAADDRLRTAVKSTETRKENEEKRKADLQRAVNIDLPTGVHHGDFYELSCQIPDSSIELIFTDPPYDGESVHLYEKAAEVAATRSCRSLVCGADGSRSYGS